MKKLIGVGLLLLLLLVGCSSDTDETTDKESNISDEPAQEEKDVAEKPKSEYPFPSDTTEIGEGKLSIQTPSGDSADGTVPVLFVSDDVIMDSVGYTIENFDGDKEVFLYVNEIFVDANQGGYMSQSSLELEDWLLDPGEYEVVAAQFEGNDPNNKVVSLSKAKYKVEQGS
ncbi:hypothetical protein [Bacillus seohaeanensis]|uniref:Lipoprotein n=1 Tax=Bacillus seohaeanensis TaxID=284580 RepID=A0ABW5RRA4_9BACI